MPKRKISIGAWIIIFILVFITIDFILYFKKVINAGELINFIGVILLGAIALFEEQVRRKWLAPELLINFELNPPFCSKTPLYIEWGDNYSGKHKISTEAYYFRFGVINSGKSQARLCETFIAELQEYKENRWQEVEYFQQVNLKWDTGKSQDAYMNLNPAPIRLLGDIGHIVKEDTPGKDTKVFHLDYLYSIGGYQPQYLSPNKRYKFKIIVASENANFVSQTFELYWTGIWKDNTEAMFNEITITPV